METELDEVAQRNGANGIVIMILEIYCKELAKKHMESEKSNNVHQAGGSGELVVWLWSKSKGLRTQGAMLISPLSES